jgi:hypothetical protein
MLLPSMHWWVRIWTKHRWCVLSWKHVRRARRINFWIIQWWLLCSALVHRSGIAKLLVHLYTLFQLFEFRINQGNLSLSRSSMVFTLYVTGRGLSHYSLHPTVATKLLCSGWEVRIHVCLTHVVGPGLYSIRSNLPLRELDALL